MKVKEIAKRDIIKVSRATSLRQLLIQFKDFHRLPSIPVADKSGHLIGVVYLNNLLDILRPQSSKLLKNLPFMEMEVEEDIFDFDLAPTMGDLILVDDIMESNYVTISAEASLSEAYKLMQLHRVEQLLVVDDKNILVGIIGIFDIVWIIFKEKQII